MTKELFSQKEIEDIACFVTIFRENLGYWPTKTINNVIELCGALPDEIKTIIDNYDKEQDFQQAD